MYPWPEWLNFNSSANQYTSNQILWYGFEKLYPGNESEVAGEGWGVERNKVVSVSPHDCWEIKTNT